MADDDGKKGISEAHTQADPPPNVEPDPDLAAKIGDAAALGQAALNDLAAQIPGGADPEQSSLFEDDDCLFAGPVKHVADTFQAAKGRGRPRGSKNKNSQQFRDYVLAKGYRHPGLNLADMANADPDQLAKQLGGYRETSDGKIVYAGCTPKEAYDMIMKANDLLMPYFESKRPVDVQVTERQLGVLVIESGAGGGPGQVEEGVYSVTGVIGQNHDKSDT